MGYVLIQTRFSYVMVFIYLLRNLRHSLYIHLTGAWIVNLLAAWICWISFYKANAIQKTEKSSYRYIWCGKVQQYWKTILLVTYVTLSLILLHYWMTSIKRYLPHVLNNLYGKRMKISNYHFSLEAWLDSKWNNFPNFQEVSHHISFYLPQCLGKLTTHVHYDFCCCVVNPIVLLSFQSWTNHTRQWI